MKHENPHKLNFACLDCVRKHMEHKRMLMEFVGEIARNVCDDQINEAVELLNKIRADNE